MASSFQILKERLLSRYPDASGLTLVTSTERGRTFLRHLVHQEVGGLMPRFQSYDEYRASRLGEAINLGAISRREELIYLTLFLQEHHPGYRKNPGIAASGILPALRLACTFSLEREEMKNLKGIREEHFQRIDELFDTMEGLDEFLSHQKRFMPILREPHFQDIHPGESDLFVNLPLFTPSTEAFFARVPPSGKLIDMPVFADALRALEPDYPSSLRLLRRAGVPLRKSAKVELSFLELQGKATAPPYLRRAIAEFLTKGPQDRQMFILLLDENLAFYLWQTVFKHFHDLVNFSVGLPLALTSIGVRIGRFIGSVSAKSTEAEFMKFKAELAYERRRHRETYVREDLYALDAGIDFVDSLQRYHEKLGSAFSQTAMLLLQQTQFFIKGERSAPVQLVGLGDATGIPFDYGIVLPLNSEAFPSKLYNGPFLNFVHTPQIRDTHLEMEDLALRQFMSFGKRIDLVSIFDEAKQMTPSFFFAFLKNEFCGTLRKCSASMPAASTGKTLPFVENSPVLLDRIHQHSFSFSSLGHLLTCSFGFYYTYIERVSIPEAMQDEESISLALGSFVHEFFKHLSLEEKPIERWRALFEALWEKSQAIAEIPGKEAFKLFVLSYLQSLVEHEPEEERHLLFGPAKRHSEKHLEACLGSESPLRLNGRLDTLIEHDDGRLTIIDFKYKRRPAASTRPLADALEGVNSFDPRFQLALYAYLLTEAQSAPPERIQGYFVYLKEDDPRKRFEALDPGEVLQIGSTMQLLTKRVEEILARDRFEPNYRSRNCPYCFLKCLCKAENFYRKSF